MTGAIFRTFAVFLLLVFAGMAPAMAQDDPGNAPSPPAAKADADAGVSAESYQDRVERARMERAQKKLEALGAYNKEINRMRSNLVLESRLSGVKPTSPENLRSLLFTVWQHALIQEFKEGVTTRTVSEEELNQDQETRPKGIREISLSGIAYKNPDEWTVWLNGQRVTPEAIPVEVLDIRVDNEMVELKWFDAYNNLIFPIRLRTHQRFNLDSRIFLPGVSAKK